MHHTSIMASEEHDSYPFRVVEISIISHVHGFMGSWPWCKPENNNILILSLQWCACLMHVGVNFAAINSLERIEKIDSSAEIISGKWSAH